MTLTPLDIVLLLVALAAVGFAFWRSQQGGPDLVRLTAERNAEREERAREVDGLRSERDAQRQRADAAEKALAAGQAQIAEREKSFAREAEQMTKLQAESETRFKALADAALLKSQQQFVQIADETLKKHKEGAQGELGKMLQPIQESFGQFREKVAEIEKVRSEDRAAMGEQIRQVSEHLSLTRVETAKLANVLAAPKAGGRWGEQTLKNVLEIAGLAEHIDFKTQVHSETSDGSIRPDVVVNMPEGRQLVIDAKVSIDDYLMASEELDPKKRDEHLDNHTRKIRAHVKRLGEKPYWNQFAGRVDFVAMFVPGENFYSAALARDPKLFEYAAERQIIVVSPTTLLGLAKVVAYAWRQEKVSQNTEQVSKLAKELYGRMVTLGERVVTLGRNIKGSVSGYNALVATLEGKVLPQARKFEELGAGQEGKALPTLDPIEDDVRQPQKDRDLLLPLD